MEYNWFGGQARTFRAYTHTYNDTHALLKLRAQTLCACMCLGMCGTYGSPYD